MALLCFFQSPTWPLVNLEPRLAGPPEPAVLPDWGGEKPDTETHWPPHGFDFCVILISAEHAEESLWPCLRAADDRL